ncbi:hypothetical protein EV702DRAFT_1202811 [Suillus placidus]|uniref:Uncharacterized protein n=1 Tax=Suillus placidus TaxID=48579 RepID=A0A9P6ZK20_9AGAM|nr:hypothetical protein EV702DRAFT_1202811 [Suillus placidus]
MRRHGRRRRNCSASDAQLFGVSISGLAMFMTPSGGRSARAPGLESRSYQTFLAPETFLPAPSTFNLRGVPHLRGTARPAAHRHE